MNEAHEALKDIVELEDQTGLCLSKLWAYLNLMRIKIANLEQQIIPPMTHHNRSGDDQ